MKIARIGGGGTTTTAQDYSFTHRNLADATSYYRLKQVDFDGTEELLQTIASSCHGAESITVSPNPGKDFFRLQHISAGDKIEVYNALGNPVFHAVAKTNFADIDLSGHPKGIFWVAVISNDKKQVVKVVKQ